MKSICRGFSVTARISVFAIGSLLISNESADAKIHPFLTIGGTTGKTIREEKDELLDTQELKDWRQGWSAGAGLRFLSSQGNSRDADRPTWEVRVKLEASGGSLEDVRVEFSREGEYEVLTVDTYDHTGWSFGASALARVHPQVGFFAGPSLERLSLKSDRVRTWDGSIPPFCPSCGALEGDAEATLLYGVFEVGTRFEMSQLPAALEFYWIPRRIQMSSTQTVDEDGYRGNFAEFSASMGVRATYDF